MCWTSICFVVINNARLYKMEQHMCRAWRIFSENYILVQNDVNKNFFTNTKDWTKKTTVFRWIRITIIYTLWYLGITCYHVNGCFYQKKKKNDVNNHPTDNSCWTRVDTYLLYTLTSIRLQIEQRHILYSA